CPEAGQAAGSVRCGPDGANPCRERCSGRREGAFVRPISSQSTRFQTDSDVNGPARCAGIEPCCKIPTLSSRPEDGHTYHPRRSGRQALTRVESYMAVANEVEKRPAVKKTSASDGTIERDRLKMMMLIRRFEERTYKEYTEPGQKIGGFCHLYS